MPASSTATPLRCPDCGAELKPGVTTCWMCNYRPPAHAGGGAVQQSHTPWLPTIGFVLLAVAFIPACCVAFFASCLVGANAIREDFEVGMLSGLVGASIVATLLSLLLYQLYRLMTRRHSP